MCVSFVSTACRRNRRGATKPPQAPLIIPLPSRFVYSFPTICTLGLNVSSRTETRKHLSAGGCLPRDTACVYRGIPHRTASVIPPFFGSRKRRRRSGRAAGGLSRRWGICCAQKTFSANKAKKSGALLTKPTGYAKIKKTPRPYVAAGHI